MNSKLCKYFSSENLRKHDHFAQYNQLYTYEKNTDITQNVSELS